MRCHELALKLAHIEGGSTTIATSAPRASVNYAASDSEGKIANECQVGRAALALVLAGNELNCDHYQFICNFRGQVAGRSFRHGRNLPQQHLPKLNASFDIMRSALGSAMKRGSWRWHCKHLC